MAKGPGTMPKDYYQILGVPRDASAKDLKRAYRSLARQCHPDVNRDDPDCEQRFKDLQEAYGVLSDPDKRRQYDRFGADFEAFRGAGPQGFRFDGGETIDLSGLGGVEDLLGGLFGRGAGRAGGGFFGARAAAGADVEVAVTVSLEEVDRGATRDVTVTVEDGCRRCGGAGRDGRGQPCGACQGRGHSPRRQQVKGVRIPAGVDDQAVLRVRGKGGGGAGGGPDGDLLLRVAVRPHAFFTRQGDDLECEVPISLAEAVRGAEIPVPTLQGRQTLRLPAGTQGGQRFRIKGFGLPNRRTGQRGNLLVRCRVVVPRDLTPAEQDAIEAASARAGDPRADLWQP